MTSTFVGQRRRARCALLAATTVLTLGVASPALAQLVAPAPVRQSIDANGVDLFNGTFTVTAPALTIGQSAPQGLSYVRVNEGAGWTDNITLALNLTGSTMTVAMGSRSDTFSVSGTTYSATEGNGASLTLSGNVYTYQSADGTVIHFDKTRATSAPYYSNAGRATDLVRPSGEKLVFNYGGIPYCESWKSGASSMICLKQAAVYVLASVRNSYGYQISLQHPDTGYVYDPSDPATQPDFATVSKITGATVTNLAVASGASTPSETFDDTPVGGNPTLSVTDPMARVTRYRLAASGGVAGVTLPGSSAEDLTVITTGNRVTSVATPRGTTSYSSADLNGVRTVTVTNALNQATITKFDIASQRITSVTDANGHTVSAQYDASGRPKRITQPEGNYTEVTYDGRGNVIEQHVVAKTGAGPGDLVTYAGYDASCTSGTALTCNQPNWTKDANGNQTDYIYSAVHGGVLSVKSPAPVANAVRPETRYTYSSLQAYFKNGTGSIVASGEPVWLMTGSSTCQTGATCSGTADEVKASVEYGPQTAGTGNNLLPKSASKGSGDGVLTATTAYGYDDIDNAITVDGPLLGAADTTRSRYDADRELVGQVSPDPDGAGPLKPRATRTSFDSKGRGYVSAFGTVVDQSDTAWTNFAESSRVSTIYDAKGLVIRQTQSANNTDYAVADYLYDALGRRTCSIVKMDPAQWGPQASSCAPQQTNGANGPDRVSKSTFDPAGQLTESRVGVGTPAEAPEASYAYSNNGRLASLIDGEGNKTSYLYDAFDRLSETHYPSPTKGAGTSSASDYEGLGYDAASNITSRRLRDAKSISYAYDALNRIVTKTLPSPEAAVTMTYDNLSRVNAINQTGSAISFGYDALSRQISDTQPFGSLTRRFDLSGNLTRTTWWDNGFHIDYDRLVTSELSKVRENDATTGAGVLATFGYDGLGRRTSLTRGNGTTTAYTFDNVSRLSGLSHDLSGTSSDLTLSFGYNPASQIASTTRSNDAYAAIRQTNANRGYTINGLNQMTAVGPVAQTFDARGNLTSAGASSYGYTAENMLKSAPGATLYYDALHRLVEYDTSVSRRFVFDGANVAAEVNNPAGAIQHRYVWGDGADELLVDYDYAAGGSDPRRFVHADERGSVIGLSDSSGNTTRINRYDEYGNPAANNGGWFQYTGQAWLPELGLYNYKARMYSPMLGRFMQTDPIGYGDGPNWYNYVGGNPITERDPSGKGIFGPEIHEKCYGNCGPGYANDSENGFGWWNESDLGGGFNLDFLSSLDFTSEGNGSSAHTSTAPNISTYHVTIEPGLTRNHGYYNVYTYDLRNGNGDLVTARGYSIRENTFGATNSTAGFIDIYRGHFSDIVGFTSQNAVRSLGSSFHYEVLQTFTLRYGGREADLSTQLAHNHDISDGVVSNSVTVIVP